MQTGSYTVPSFSSPVDLDAITEQLTHHDSVNLCDLPLFSRSLQDCCTPALRLLAELKVALRKL